MPNFLQPGRTLVLFQFQTAFNYLLGGSDIAGMELAAPWRTFQTQSMGCSHNHISSVTAHQWRRQRVSCTACCCFACGACLTDKNVVMAAAIARPGVPNSTTVGLVWEYRPLLWNYLYQLDISGVQLSSVLP